MTSSVENDPASLPDEENEMSLSELVLQAMAALDTLRYPNVQEVQRRLHAVLKAAGKGGIEHDRIDDMFIRLDHLIVKTTFSVRSCEQSVDREIPMSVIEANDPIEAARTWGKESRISAAKQSVREAERNLARAQKQLEEAQNS